MRVEGRLGRQTAEGFECQLTLLDDRRPAISSQNAGSHAGNHDGLRKHSLPDLNSLSDTHLRNLMRTVSLKTQRRGARTCAFIQLFSTVLALPEKNGTR